MRLAAKLLAVAAILYAGFLALVLAVLYQPPGTVGRFMAKLPRPLAVILPFRALWSFARAGNLEPGVPAPGFELETHGRGSRVRLSSFHGNRPVVLVFGSYT